MKETNITRIIMLALSKIGRVTSFRNNVGLGWQGETSRLKDGSIIIRNPRPLHAGLCTGSSDLIGWTQREITPDMVGKKVAVFTAIEVKGERGTVSKEQLAFINRVRECGGIAGIARTPDEAVHLIDGYK
jgi:hypothetical protein